MLRKGFGAVDLIITAAIIFTATAIAIPRMLGTVNSLQLAAAAQSAKSAIQTTRYQAIMHGYPYQLTIPATLNSRVSSKAPGVAEFSNVGNAVPLTGVKSVVLSQATVLQFNANGSVQATSGAMTFTMTYNHLVRTITVSANGDVAIN